MTKKQLIELDVAVSNIQMVLSLANASEWANGPSWYANALETCHKLSKDYDVSWRTVAGVVAALSPNNRWERNVRDAESLIAAYLNGDDILTVSVSTYHTMRAKAWSILEQRATADTAILKLLNGRKIMSFYLNITGDADSVTIDGHARNIAYGERLSLSGSKFTIGVREYKLLSEAYRIVGLAASPRLKAFEVQAITWTTWRRIHGI